MLLVLVTSSSGIAASRLLPAHPGAVTVLVAVTVAGALVSLIVSLGRISGGHYNPLITSLQFLAGERSARCTAAYVLAQMLGGIIGGGAAAVLWRASPPLVGGLGWAGFPSEFVASIGLMLVVFGASRSNQLESGPFAVGAWLVGAVIATPTGSYANPAVVAGATVTAGPLAMSLQSAVPYVVAESGGALVALLLVSVIFSSKQVIE
ncbi:MIP family protein [Sphingomonas glacialis]|uniref:MIP family protein n=2 Tax=Sphingomonas glacialis TaxID=658225 RepID=A0A502FVT3_9SPHN|nr:MIP family protein [Sphingomonas glacialis]